MKKLVLIMTIVLVAAVVLPAKAQNYRAEQPNATFQSTSAMKGSGSAYSANPTLNTNGTAAAPTAGGIGGPRKAKKEGEGPGGIEVPEIVVPSEDDKPTPLGDAVLPLLLMAVAFGGVIAIRRKKRAEA